MTIKIYLDEDAQDGDFVRALLFRNVDVLSSGEAGMNGRKDEEQLEFATRQGKILFSHNVKDFSALHAEYLRTGRDHTGIILAHQQQFGIGEQTRRLLRLSGTLSAEEMQTRLEFLSSW